MNIGEVLDRLRPDFPGITIPKIRFLEDKGLIKPERTPAGYRKFSHEDVERLRYVLCMQRDHYLPLKVIGEHLDAIDRGLLAPRRPADLAAGAGQDRRDLRGPARPARAVRPDQRPARHRPLRRRRPGHRAHRP
jgi:DNA-binding transcriptional MerR regulator